MKLFSYFKSGHDQLALLYNDCLYDLNSLSADLPGNMADFLKSWDDNLAIAANALAALKEKANYSGNIIPYNSVQLMSPVPLPTSLRDGYAFRQHVAAARRNRKVDMIPEFDQYPVFYFSNHRNIQGPGEIECMPDHFEKLDFELEAAVVICKKGRNIKAEEADAYIGGLMIMNDLSARRLQMEEMLLNLGPAKGKDFATAIGPCLVTLNELSEFEIPPRKDHTGKSWNLKMTCKVNGMQVSEGNLGDMDWTFAEIIERASYGVDLYPGDIIGSGTVGTGCFLELNGTGKLHDPDYKEQWLNDGDKVELAIDQLGVLENTIVAEKIEWSILKKKLNSK
ncbi:MAG: fumarylacetoacetate hydrolase family protein [Segetibacter sp.]